MLKKLILKYKRFEKIFLKEDKAMDMTNYIKRKYHFRSMMCVSGVTMIPALYNTFVHHTFPFVTIIILLGVLLGFRTKSYNAINSAFSMMMMLFPLRCLLNSLVLTTPIALLWTTVEVLIQTQSDKLTMLHLVVQAIGFYFYGMERMTATMRGMSVEELIQSAQSAMKMTFTATLIIILCIRVFYSQFSSLLRKVNTLTENIRKANSQLNDQNLKLQSNLEMKDVFIYTFSHELKNALNGLLGNLTLAYDVAKNSQVTQHLSSAKVCGEVLNNFIHNILDSGKLENGNLEVSPERKDVMNFMQNVWSICGRIIQNKRLKGSLKIETHVPKLLDLDEQRMIQILLNLVSNACKFTEKGYVRIHVSWQTISTQQEAKEEGQTPTNNNREGIHEEKEERRVTTHVGDMREFPDTLEARPSKKENYLVTGRPKKFIDGSQFYELNLLKSHWNQEEVLSSTLPEGSKGILKIQVLDSGCGMTAEQQEKLFQKFSQVSSIEGQRKIGTGLGLWICKELATRLNGDITTRSVVGVGSVFELSIRAKVSVLPKKPPKRPLKRTQVNESTSQTRSASEPRSAYSSLNMLKILIADDDSFNIELMKNYLSKFGINYICAYDGEEAVLLFKKHYKEIGFVITDNFMPKKTGTEAAFEIASFLEEKRLPKVPIICISGDLKVSVGEKGITSVIQKPINFDRLKEELMTVYPQLTQFTNEGDR